jgi:hypothetical protein
MQTIYEPIEGIAAKYAAVRTGDAEFARIDVLDDEGDAIFTVPADWTPELVNVAIRVYLRGVNRGKTVGKAGLQFELRQLLGCGN